MKQFFPLVFFSFAAMLFAQDSPPKFDGVINQEEWKNAQVFLLDYEIDPGDNTPAQQLSNHPKVTTQSKSPVFSIAIEN